MPTLLAVVVAIVVSLALERLIEPYVSARRKALISLVVFFAVAYAARRQLLRLRDGE